MNKKNIYFDSNASTPVSQEVASAIYDTLLHASANPSSVTAPGRRAKSLILHAKKNIAQFLGVTPKEITFTSGGTESLLSLIRGICLHRHGRIITTKIEHSAVLESVNATQKSVSYLGVDQNGIPNIEKLEEFCKKDAAAIVLSLVNGEIGTILPLEKIACIAEQYNIPLIIDGVAALGKMPIHLYPGVTGMAFSGHKCHGPKGSGFFYLKNNTPFTPLFSGGKQESGKRAGTENTPAIVGLSVAISQIDEQVYLRLLELREYFEKQIAILFPDSIIHGGENRISNVSNVYFKDVDGDHLLIHLDQMGIAVSLGAACSSGTLKPSHVLSGIGLSKDEVASSIRFSFNKTNTFEEIDTCINALIAHQSFTLV